MKSIRKLGVSLLASAVMATGMLPSAAYADFVTIPLQEIIGRWNRLAVDQMQVQDDLEDFFRSAYSGYADFDHFEAWPEFAQLSNLLDARCTGSPAHGQTGTTNHQSSATEQKEKAAAVLLKMQQSVQNGGMGTTAFDAWYASRKLTLINTTGGGQMDVRLMTIIWANGSSTSFPIFKSGTVQIMNQNVVDPTPAPQGQGSSCAG